ncbi:hypothetical protein CDD80_7148 [Ophiocordyceps camponoti-rufipedis]|uniref:Uncharacterized protein n=1 Tax=Ophiocordyceps camponoti-rufipedis TaxID=2004952 RepID=A0A2C5Z8S9_9HYPO|nr:hypothetical protein CDD80_7148 [Ophiocordyceps camponoti-rufipedis]
MNGITESPNNPDRFQEPFLLVLSAASERSLNDLVQLYDEYIASGNVAQLESLALTLSSHRDHMAWRTFAVVHDRLTRPSPAKPFRSSSQLGLAFVFTGQGAHYVNMGSGLLRYPVFEATLRRIDDILSGLGCGWSVLEQLSNKENLQRPEYQYQITCSLQIALVHLLRTFNVLPGAVVGHSSGEVAAAYTIGALSLESACKVAYFRGLLSSQSIDAGSRGAMLSVNIPHNQVPSYLERLLPPHLADRVSVACINSPLNSTLAGSCEAIEALQESLDREGSFSHKLSVDLAYHTEFMRPLCPDYRHLMGNLDGADSPQKGVPMFSSVTGALVDPALLATAGYWVKHLTAPVNFSEAVTNLVREQSITDLIEVGPHAALKRPVGDIVNNQVRHTPTLNRNKPASDSMMECLGTLYSYGYPVSITAVNQHETAKEGVHVLVDCPKYPFAHSRTYWHESRLSRDYRLREAVDEILGFRANDFNPLEPRWRRFLSVESMPWIAGHSINGQAVFPAAGLVLMAIEAARLASPCQEGISGFCVKEAQFMEAIKVAQEAENSTELMLQLRPINLGSDAAAWSEVSIFAYNKGQCTQCFRCIIRATISQEPEPLETMDEEAFTRYVHPDYLYQNLERRGIKYSGSFKALREAWLSDQGVATAWVKTQSEHVHTVVLDAIMQLVHIGNSGDRSEAVSAVKATRMADAWFASTGWRTSDIRCTKRARDRPRGIFSEQSIYAVSETGSVLCDIETLETMQQAATDNVDTNSRLLHSIQWKPQLSLLDSIELQRLCEESSRPSDESALKDKNRQLDHVLRRVLSSTLKQLSDLDRSRVTGHLGRYLAWMEHHVDRDVDDADDRSLEELLQHVERLNPTWTLFTSLSRRLKSILVGESDALEMIYGTGMAEELYLDYFAPICDDRLFKFLDLLTHEKPGLRILEVGAGTGGMTSFILQFLQKKEKQTGSRMFSNYTYTDISPSFFEKASERWSALQDRVVFKVFDLERSGDSQGLEPASYDVVIAACVLHTTRNVSATIRTIRDMLEPDGRLLFMEPTAPDKIAAGFPWGLLPGWWRGDEDWRAMSALGDVERWRGLLAEDGFRVDVCFGDYDDGENRLMSVMVAVVKDMGDVVIVLQDGSDQDQLQVADFIRQKRLGETRIAMLKDAQTMVSHSHDLIIFLAEMDKPLLTTTESLENIQALMAKKSNRLLWITATASQARLPHFYLAQGFLRSMRIELPDKHIVSLTIELQDWSIDSISKYIATVIDAILSGSPEVDFIARNGHLLTGRGVEEVVQSERLRCLISPDVSTEPWSSGPALRLSIGCFGDVDTLRFIRDERAFVTLAAHEVEIEAKAWPVTTDDVLVARGLVDHEFGFEAAGIVTRLGPDCRMGLQLGDRVVMVCSSGSMCSFPRSQEAVVARIPDGVSFQEAVSIISCALTPCYALLGLGGLRNEDSILIQGSGGCISNMSVRIALAQGADVFVAVQTDRDADYLTSECHLAPDRIINTARVSSWHRRVLRLTDGKGVDMLLNSLDEDALAASSKCLAPYGKLIDISRRNVTPPPLSSNKTYSRVDLRELLTYKPDLVSTALEATVSLTARGVLGCPATLQTYSVSQVRQAFDVLDANHEDTGAVVVSVDPLDKVERVILETHPWRLSEDASYLVCGGFGGLGRVIVPWLVERGAKNLIILSRSGPSSREAKRLVSDLTKRGVRIEAPRCDASSAESLAGVLEKCHETMPRVRGCINAAMILNGMTHQKWQTVIDSKVRCSWNLDQLLPQLDFFVLLSSVSSITGSAAQSNYAAGCSFQDALVRNRSSGGQRSVSIGLSIVKDAGNYANSKLSHVRFTVSSSFRHIDTQQLLAALSLYCDPEKPPCNPDDSHVLLGWTTPADCVGKGEPPPECMNRPLFAPFQHVSRQDLSPTAITQDTDVLFRLETDPDKRTKIISNALVAKLARVMSVSRDDIDVQKPPGCYGVDSLSAMDLHRWAMTEFDADLETSEIVGASSVNELVELMVSRAACLAGGTTGSPG